MEVVLYFQAFLTLITVGPWPALLHFNAKMFGNIVAAVLLSLLLFMFIYSNYKMFKIAKSKCGDERVAPTAAMSTDENSKTRIFNLKSISTCSLAVIAVFSVVPSHELYIQLYV
jgi:hypothetical protein